MEPGPPNLLLLLLPLLLLLHLSPFAAGQALYIIDAVGLSILPGSTVASGTMVTLHCRVRVSSDNTRDLMHNFQIRRDDVLVHSASTTKDNVVLVLNPARAADTGYYECRVTVRDRSKNSHSQRLDVTGLQTPIFSMENKTLYEGDDFSATCSAPGERGSLTFRFFQRFKNEEPQRMKQVASAGNVSETSLVLRHTGDFHLFCDYEINLVSGTRSSNHSNEVQVTVKVLHIVPTMNVLPSSEVYEGDLLEVTCKVVESPKKVDVFLVKDRSILKNAKSSLVHRFRPQEGDTGELVCKAVAGNTQKETYALITVKELYSRPRLSVEPLEIFQGDVFKLTCSVSVYVPERISNGSLQFSFYRDNVKVGSSETFEAMAGPRNNGNYTCKAQAVSLLHSFVKESPTLVVSAKVLASEPVLSVVGGTLILGKRFQLSCGSEQGTLPIIYFLFGPEGRMGHRTVSEPGQSAIFNASAVRRHTDLNKFICHAKNSLSRPPMVGSVNRLLQSTVIIEPVSDPLFSIVPGMGDVSEGQDLSLICSVERGTLPITFAWHHVGEEDALDRQTSDKRGATFFIRNVRPEHKGAYFCVGSNAANEHKESSAVVITVKLASWKKALISMSCILPVLALLFLVVFKTGLCRCGGRRRGELSVKSAGTKVERLSLTQSEVNEANATPGMMGKSVWSDRVSCSESDERLSESAAAEPEYTEVVIKQPDPNRVTSSRDGAGARNSRQGVPEQNDAGSVEYAELNHDKRHHGNHGDHADNGSPVVLCVQDDQGNDLVQPEGPVVQAVPCVDTTPLDTTAVDSCPAD